MPYRDIRIQLIPIEWHKHIHEQTDESLNNISLKNIPGMRLVGNDYIMDGLYYLAKDRQQTIITHVTRTFNEAYHEFIDSHPTFQGLITWDILAHQRSITTMEEQAQLDKLDLNVPHLDFKPQFLFGVGCPLGAFLNIRNQDPKLYCPDSSTVFENIYHPCDPLAYRVEPLYHPECRHHDSVQVESAIPNDASTPIFSSLTDWVTSWFKRSNEKLQDDIQVSSTPQSPKKSSIKASNMPPVSQLSMPTMNDPNMLYRRRQSQIYDSPQSWMMEKKKRRQSLPNLHRSPRISSLEEDTMLLQSLPGSRRVDYALQPGPMFGGMISNQYLLGLQAHFSYWNNKDMLWHMVDQLDNAIH
ncbi:DDHD domain-containing protein [Halteromyces radiatus]|uniref:DDHD domain-containing protein n=1 Tax=Halteromyces radiatus TaxID=101107 RepID=UPI002220A05D|nr:DDHD domain-containing protein [Halteromyces radiatus]KAI8082725.1 DDHD domain-containing protein [Halteromyces radiatus]